MAVEYYKVKYDYNVGGRYPIEYWRKEGESIYKDGNPYWEVAAIYYSREKHQVSFVPKTFKGLLSVNIECELDEDDWDSLFTLIGDDINTKYFDELFTEVKFRCSF